MSRAMLNIIQKGTSKKEVLASYREYPDTQPEGFTTFNASTVEPMVLEIPQGAKILDVGCNSGEFMKMAQDVRECDATGVDVSETAVALAKAKGLNVINADAESLPFEDATFDVVILREVLVHLHDPVKALKEIARVLKPTGFLLGSAPHKNLELVAWEDKRGMHHRYCDEERLRADLGEAFPVTHLRVLNGAQFSVTFAGSTLADQPTELLWKSGREGLPPWEHALTSDNETLRVWLGPTQPPGDAYYRMIGFAEKMRAMDGTEVGFEQFKWDDNGGPGGWQSKMIRGADGNPVSSIAVHHLEKVLKVANPWVFQITGYDDVVGLLACAKEVMPGKKLVTEIDDWLFDLPAYNIASAPYTPNSPAEKVAYEQLEISDAVIVSTSFLKESIEQLFPGKPIYVVPNAIDFDFWDNAKPIKTMDPKKEGVVRIGYTGCGNHSGDLEIVKPVLLALLDENPNVEIVMATEFECFADVKHERFKQLNVWATIPQYPGMVKGWDLDIGIAPLRDNNFNRAKSNLRWLEYSALKIPTVASTVRPFVESVSHEFTGQLCSTKREWYEALNYLIKNKSAREAYGQNANDVVRTRYNMDKVARQYRNVLQEIKRK